MYNLYKCLKVMSNVSLKLKTFSWCVSIESDISFRSSLASASCFSPPSVSSSHDCKVSVLPEVASCLMVSCCVVVKCSPSRRATLCCSWPGPFRVWAPPVLQSQVPSSFSLTVSTSLFFHRFLYV